MHRANIWSVSLWLWMLNPLTEAGLLRVCTWIIHVTASYHMYTLVKKKHRLCLCTYMFYRNAPEQLLAPFISYARPTVCSMCACPTTLSPTCCSTWWPRSGSWISPSCSYQSTEGCRTSNYSPNSSRSLAKGSSRLLWQPVPGFSLEGWTQVKHIYTLNPHWIQTYEVKSQSAAITWMLKPINNSYCRCEFF